ncbi:hypothetical protein N7508_003672 [Penicillium antarcticum]|uniref:uncharacterized protein n=1 Tax=Penicillium antarcticum TaxID=416450 RepID=UPI0023957D00|nr:uncharacterized protein N7508_003672 [Penicillium antarcticum]KAJ5312842.1 hypothetical protein N7508_003672 [Penicillium antarcticum]
MANTLYLAGKSTMGLDTSYSKEELSSPDKVTILLSPTLERLAASLDIIKQRMDTPDNFYYQYPNVPGIDRNIF